jgi:hypothetical protein
MKIQIPKTKNPTKSRLRCLSGILDITKKELEILAAFVDAQAALDDRGIEINAFSPEVKKIVAKGLGVDNYHNLNLYIKHLKDKGILKKVENGYVINSLVASRDDELTIKFL